MSKTITLMGATINIIDHGADRIWRTFTATSKQQLQKHMAEKLQMQMGYHPAGYGIYAVQYSYQDGIYTLTWKCGSTCD